MPTSPCMHPSWRTSKWCHPRCSPQDAPR
jgi:hypothetical protein